MEQMIDYCKAEDGTTLAYAVTGSGPPLIRTGMWFTHLGEELKNDAFNSLWETLSEHFTLIRYDMRGTGLSERNIGDYIEQQLISDHFSVLDAIGYEETDIFGVSQGAIVAWLVAEAQPHRVRRIVTIGAYDVGVLYREGHDGGSETVETFASIIKAGWGSNDPSFRNVFSSQFLPNASREELEWFSDYQKKTSTPEVAEKNYRFFASMNMSERVIHLNHRHLLIHSIGDRRVNISIARNLCAKLRDAKLITIESEDHVPNKRPEDRAKLYSALSDYLGIKIKEKNANSYDLFLFLDRSLEQVETSRWFKLAAIFGVILTLVSAIALIV